MGIYNTLFHEMMCPRCGSSASMEIDLFFGLRDLIRYDIGDQYQWRPRKIYKNGGRPEGGDCDGEGYAQCPVCERDFFLEVKIRADVLVGVEPDLSKEPYIED